MEASEAYLTPTEKQAFEAAVTAAMECVGPDPHRVRAWLRRHGGNLMVRAERDALLRFIASQFEEVLDEMVAEGKAIKLADGRYRQF